MRTMVAYISPYKWKLTWGLIMKTIATVMDLGLPWVLAYVIDNVIPTGDATWIVLWGFAMLILSFLSRYTNVTANRRASRLSRDVVEGIRHDLFDKVQHLSGLQVDAFTIPSLISRLTSDTYNVHSMISMMQRIGVRAPILLLGGILVTFTLDPVLTMVLIGVLPLLVLIVWFLSKIGIPLFHKVQRSQDHMVRVVRENISGIRVIKALSKTRHEKKRFSGTNHELVDMELSAGKAMAATSPLISLLLNLGLTLVIVVGAYRVNAGESESGKIVAFLSYFMMMLHAVMAINRIFVMYSRASASAERIGEVLESGEDLKLWDDGDAGLEREEGRGDNEPHVEFENVGFSYNRSHQADRDKECLSNISFAIKKGESLGVIGSTGSGKTTLIQLLMRFYDVTKGGVRIDGRDVRTIPMKELRTKFGVVFQNDVIFADTIYENIRFGRDIEEERVEEAGRHAFVDEFIKNKENGYRLQASIKGANLSGGQKQRVLIARALAGNPEILILDDSSSSLDYKTDAKLRKAIREHYKDTTTIWIAQRVSSVFQCDHIMVLEDGKRIGYGKHEDLLKTCRVYQEIYQSQMGGGINHEAR